MAEDQPLDKLSVTQIVQQAELNRGTFYKHYDSKEQLLTELIDHVLIELADAFRSPYADLHPFSLKDLTPGHIKIFDHVYEHARFYSAVLNSKVIPGVQERIIDTLKHLAKDVVPSGQMAQTDIVPHLFISYYAHALFGLIKEWVRSDFCYSSSYMSRQLIQILRQQPVGEAPQP
ncbi:TetR/AcrR family transcriptional regulator [Salisediminibacterium beveridgei]|uniref:TetR/AcrR family transcriptional regulator n=1 Tax=Salisediminibacterium beveridgei TaxID=632773 RepID=UPI0018DD2930|nr:TetR/AcrR family transcriptional regulator [Salisediminibacterium beveridgei]